ncbi:phage minor head protein [Laceyella putida]|uniref:Phage minor head protein n=1 Tax=Laceyella putida TaxID=110101 RepID=A0ABW2RQT3_9BACL
MSVIRSFQLGQMTLNEARLALGLEPDPILGNQRIFDLLPPPLYDEKELEVEEYLSQFDDFDDTIRRMEDDVIPLFEEEWIRFIRTLRLSLLSSLSQKSWSQKALSPDAKKKLRKRLRDKVRRETKTLSDLIASHVKRLHDPLATYVNNELARRTGKVPINNRFDDWYIRIAEEHAKSIMDRYLRKIDQLLSNVDLLNDEQANQVLDEFWKSVEQRARMISTDITVSAANALLVHQFRQYGIEEKMWKAERTACPFCQALHGHITGLDESFIQKGDALEVEGKKPLLMVKDLLWPPVHPNCQCSVIPVIRNQPVRIPVKPQAQLNRPLANHWRRPQYDPVLVRNYQKKVRTLLQKEPMDVDTILQIGNILHDEIERRYEKIYRDYQQTVDELNTYMGRKLTEEEERKKNELMITLFRQERRKEERLRDIRLRVLSQFQDFGYHTGDKRLSVFPVSGDDQEKKQFERFFAKQVAPYLPRSILQKISEQPMVVQFQKKGRASYSSHGVGTMTIKPNYDDPITAVSVFHETMHRIEHLHEPSRELEQQYFYKVVESNGSYEIRSLSEVMVKHYGFPDSEAIHRIYGNQEAIYGGFGHFYNNVYYKDYFYELLSVGSEVLFGGNAIPTNSRKDMEKDPEYIMFLLGWWASIK